MMRFSLLGGAAILSLVLGVTALGARAEEDPRLVPAPVQAMPASGDGPATLTVSGGCFWGIQGVFEHVRGVRRAVAGYAGGAADTATYDRVSDGDTGHAESVQIIYDPGVVSRARLLQIFFSVALDPTEHDRQGPDEGTQYRSEIWTTSAAEAVETRAYIAQLDKAHLFGRPIATRVDRLPGFYRAEGYHQDFFARNPDNGYIAVNDMPKVEALKRLFPADYVAAPVLAGASAS